MACFGLLETRPGQYRACHLRIDNGISAALQPGTQQIELGGTANAIGTFNYDEATRQNCVAFFQVNGIEAIKSEFGHLPLLPETSIREGRISRANPAQAVSL